MNRRFQNLIANYRAWMYGRYGYDELSKSIMLTALVLVIFSAFAPALYIIALGLMVWSLFRTYSKNTYRRYDELQKFLNVKNKCKQFFNLRKRMFRERKTHKYYKCSSCKVYLKVPKGRGKIEIHCPKCSNRFIKTT